MFSPGHSSLFSIVTTFRCWMTKMSAGDFGQVIIRVQQEWSHLFAPCQWDWMTAGTRFSSICQTSPGGPMEPITSRRCAYRLRGAAIIVSTVSMNVPSVSLSLSFLPFPPQIHANCRIRRVYFSDRLYSEDELPAEFKLYLPVQNQKAKVDATLNSSLWTFFPTCLTLRFLLVSCSSRIFTCSPGGGQCMDQTLWITVINVRMSVKPALDLDVVYIEYMFIYIYINLKLWLFFCTV